MSPRHTEALIRQTADMDGQGVAIYMEQEPGASRMANEPEHQIELKEFLRAAIKAAGLTQQDIANRMKVTRNAVNLWLNPKKTDPMPPARVRQIAEILELPLSEILAHEEPGRLSRTWGEYVQSGDLKEQILETIREDEERGGQARRHR